MKDESDFQQAIKVSMADAARPAFNDRDIVHLGVLIRLAVEFYDFLNSKGPWPRFPEDPFNDRTYLIESIFGAIDSFRIVMQAYGIMIGATVTTVTTIDWDNVTRQSLNSHYVSVFDQFVDEKVFERKCRLLLDLLKLQIFFASVYYDTPNGQKFE
jgi:hypothetical protein